MNVVSLFDRRARLAPSAPALVWSGGTLSYGQLRELAQAMAAALALREIGPGDRVALLLGNDPSFVIALLGTLWLGATAAVLSPVWAPADSATALADADVRVLITTGATATSIGAAPESTLVVDEDAGVSGFIAALGRVATRGRASPAPRSAGDAATILFSSGTTGDPKGVVLTHGNLVFNAHSKIRYCGIVSSDRLAMVVPMAHCFGQNVVLLGGLLAGATVCLYPRLVAPQLHDDIARGEISMLLAAPTAFERLLAIGPPRELRRLRYALTAAAPMADGLAERWRGAGGPALAQGYGLTECSPFAAHDATAADSGRRVGRPIEGVSIRIAREDGDSWMPAGGVGEIAIRGPNVMSGYWRRPAETARALRRGWLHTGDVGFIDGEGAVHVLDRVDDVINVAGFKAWPSDIERVLARHPAVLESAAYASPDPVRGSTVAAVLVVREGKTVDLAEVTRFAAERLASFQRPTRLRIVDALPRSGSGKVLRRTLGLPLAGEKGVDHGVIHDRPANTDRPATALPAPSR